MLPSPQARQTSPLQAKTPQNCGAFNQVMCDLSADSGSFGRGLSGLFGRSLSRLFGRDGLFGGSLGRSFGRGLSGSLGGGGGGGVAAGSEGEHGHDQAQNQCDNLKRTLHWENLLESKRRCCSVYCPLRADSIVHYNLNASITSLLRVTLIKGIFPGRNRTEKWRLRQIGIKRQNAPETGLRERRLTPRRALAAGWVCSPAKGARSCPRRWPSCAGRRSVSACCRPGRGYSAGRPAPRSLCPPARI